MDVTWDGFPDGSYPTGTFHDKYLLTSNIHWESPPGTKQKAPFVMEVTDYTQWHIYGLEYTPEKLIWYIDGVKVREETDHPITSAMHLILNYGGSPEGRIAGGTSKKMYVDYVRHYTLDSDCQVINTPTYNFGTHDNKVKQSITIGNSGTTNQLQVGDDVYLRAKQSIQINGTFDVPLGSELLPLPE